MLGLNYFDRMTTPTLRGTWNFAVARLARVYPLYLAVLAFAIAGRSTNSASTSGAWRHVLGLQAWSSQLNVVFGFNGPGWSISVELLLYASFPLLVVALARIRTPTLNLLALIAVVTVMFVLTVWFVHVGRADLPIDSPDGAHRWLYRTPVTRLGDFTAGILLSRLYLVWHTHRRSQIVGRYLAVSGAIAMLLLMCSKDHLLSAWSYDASYIVPSLAVIWGLATAGEGGWLASSVMVASGEASFAFYLIHTQIMFGIGAGFWPNGAVPWAVVTQVFVFLIVLGAAIGLHRMVERPARIRVGRALTLASAVTLKSTTSAIVSPVSSPDQPREFG